MSERLVKRVGLTLEWQIVGMSGIGLTGSMMLLSLSTEDGVATSVFLARGFAVSGGMLPLGQRIAWM